MTPPGNEVPFHELVAAADGILDESGDDEDALVRRLELLEPGIRNELLVSDLLNAWQVFYYCFRTIPDELVRERLELEPASSLSGGMVIDEVDLLERVFRIRDGEPSIVVSDGERPLSTFSGKTAFDDSLAYIQSVV